MSPYIERCENYLFQHLLPLWQQYGLDPLHGGAFERRNRDLTPVDTGYKRLLVQCRQLYAFSHGYQLTRNNDLLESAHSLYLFLTRHYWDERHGGWFFKVTPQGQVLDATKDTYGHAFVLFALAFYYQASRDEKTLIWVDKTMEVLLNHLAREETGGFAESAQRDWHTSVDIRRQNPHMHLLEAFVFLGEMTGNACYQEQAQKLLDLFESHFFDLRSTTLGEYFRDDWQPHPEQGHIVEPGHHFEWYWLLHRCNQQYQRSVIAAEALYQWAKQQGVDAVYGGIYNEIDRQGNMISDSKRIWPVTECIKATAVRYEQKQETEDLNFLFAMLDYLFEHYLLEDGRWHEYLSRQNLPLRTDLPGSTSYHLLLGLSEAIRVLKKLEARR